MAVDRCGRINSIYLKDHLICLSTTRTKTRNTKVVDDSFAFLGYQCDHTGLGVYIMVAPRTRSESDGVNPFTVQVQ